MKKILIMLAAVLCICSCESKKNKENIGDMEKDSLRTVVAQKENEINDLLSILNEVRSGFEAINAAEGRINVARQGGEENHREVLRQNMAEIQRTLQMNNELINTLRQQLKESSISSSKLKATMEETINNLTTQMEEKTQEIARLQSELAKKDATIAEQQVAIADLSSNVQELSHQNTQKTETVARQDKDLHTAYYVFGTKKELKQQNILDGSEVLRSKNFAKDYFTKIDTRVTKVVHLYSKSAKLMTNHPADSYTLDRDSQKQYTLRITDPEKFWSVSKYLVIVVK